MIQAPIAPIGAPSPVNAQQPPRAYVSMPQANYNAVKIDIHTPHVNTPGSQQNAVQPKKDGAAAGDGGRRLRAGYPPASRDRCSA